MNFKLIAAMALVSAALSSAPVLATPVAHLREQLNACHCAALTDHRPMLMAHAAKMPPAFQNDAPQMQNYNEWPNDLILGGYKTHQAVKTSIVAV